MIAFPQLVGNGIVNLFRQQGQGVGYSRGDLPGGQPSRSRVDRLHGQLLVFGQELRGEHLPPEQCSGDLSPEQVCSSLPQHGGDVAVVEEGKGHVAFPIGDAGFVQGHAPTDPLFRGGAQYRPLDHRHFSHNCFPDGSVKAPVLIGSGIQPQQIPHGGGAQLLKEFFSFFTNAF